MPAACLIRVMPSGVGEQGLVGHERFWAHFGAGPPLSRPMLCLGPLTQRSSAHIRVLLKEPGDAIHRLARIRLSVEVFKFVLPSPP